MKKALSESQELKIIAWLDAMSRLPKSVQDTVYGITLGYSMAAKTKEQEGGIAIVKIKLLEFVMWLALLMAVFGLSWRMVDLF